MGVSSWPLRRSELARVMRLPSLGISARSAATSAVVVLVALAFAGAAFDLILYRSLLTGVDDATAGRVRTIVDALHSGSPDDLDSALLATTQRVVAIQLIAPDGRVVKRAGSAPATPLIPIKEFDFNLRRGMPDDAVADDDMRVSGQKVNATSGQYTVLVGGGSEAVEATVRTVALLVAGTAPIITGVAAAASYRLVRRSLQSVDAIRSRVAEISTSDLAERVPVPTTRDEISALAVTMNEMLARLEAGHQAQQRFLSDASHELRSPLSTIISGLEVAEAHPELLDAELAVDTLLPEAHRMRVLIEDLLLLARADEQSLVMRKEEVALDELAEVEAARVRREAGCAIHADICPTRLTGDPAGDVSDDPQFGGQRGPPCEFAYRHRSQQPGRNSYARHQRRRSRHCPGRTNAGIRTLRASGFGPLPQQRGSRLGLSDRCRGSCRPWRHGHHRRSTWWRDKVIVELPQHSNR